MVLETEGFRSACQSILLAIDNKTASQYSETMELIASGHELKMNVTNREYFVTVKFNIEEETNFKAAVNAELFLSLVSKITSPTIELTVDGNSLKVKGNGDYKIPVIYNNDVMLELPKIDITNVTNTMSISSEILQSILQFNSKELQRGVAAKPVQKYFYIDEQGCITFTSGACVNSFTLEKPVKILLGEKIVKLFKLFKDVDTIDFSIGQDPYTDDIIQTKVKFTGGDVELTAILVDTGLVSSVPVEAIRGMASKEYQFSSVVNRKELVECINRLMLFSGDKNYGTVEFTNNLITMKDPSGENIETITPTNDCPALTGYTALMNMSKLNLILSGCDDDYVTICYGDNKAIVIKKQSISDIMPELVAVG